LLLIYKLCGQHVHIKDLCETTVVYTYKKIYAMLMRNVAWKRTVKDCQWQNYS